MTQLMNTGASWSGRERHCAFVNLKENRFADVSAALGLDFLDDGRAVAVSDWDADGDLDLIFKNRTGPQLRFMRNDVGSENHWIALKLKGKTCNRDAIGARIEVRLVGESPRVLVRELRAGDGYLSQSSKWLHFGLGASNSIEKIVVRWPGAETQTLAGPPVNARYKLTQGADEFESAPARNISIASSPAPELKTPSTTRVVLRVPLPLPPTLLDKLQPVEPTPNRPRLVNLWAHWCAPCVGELKEFARNAETIHLAGLDLVLRSVDKPDDRSAAERLFVEKIKPHANQNSIGFSAIDELSMDILDAVVRHVLDKPGAIVVPISLLIDKDGRLQIIYLGPVATDRLLADATTYGSRPEQAHERSPFRGRWYYGMDRNYRAIALDLMGRGYRSEAQFYAALWKASRGG